MAQEKIIINFKAVGNKELTRAIRELDNATRELQGKVKKYSDTSPFATKSNRLLSNSFATLRSQLLLFNFAMAMGIRQIIGFAKEASKVNSMERAFNTMAGATEDSGVAFDKLQVATDGTMSKFDLFQQANNAMILGVSKNSDEMADMFDMAQRLGNALGRNTKESVESLITGIGRQSRLMLDNIGIIVKAEEAYEAYADILEKDTDQLTDFEKKQAFLNATLESARAKVAGLPPEIMNSQMAFDRFAASTENASAEIGQAFLPLLKSLSLISADLLDNLDSDRVQRWAVAIGGAAIAFGLYKTSVRLAKIETISFQAVLAKTGWGTVIALTGLAAGGLMEYFDVFEGGKEDVSGHALAIKEAKEEQEALSDAQIEGQKSLQNQLDLLNATNEVQKMRIQLGHEASGEELQLINAIVSKTEALKAEKEIMKELERQRKEELKLFNDIADAYDRTRLLRLEASGATEKELALVQEEIRFNKALAKINLAYLGGRILNTKIFLKENEKLTEGEEANREAMLQFLKEEHGLILQIINANKEKALTFTEGMDMSLSALGSMTSAQSAQLNAEMQNMKASDAYKNASSKKREKMEEALRAKQAKERNRIARIEQVSSIAQATMSVHEAVIAALGAKPFGFWNIALATMIGAMGVAQVAAIASTPLPKFAQGGLIGGRRHSQGGTMVEAEQGEFIVNRSAVESIGIENLNRMNQGGGGTVTVNVSGNVLTQDFVEGELADNISDAIRRGVDFGIS